MVTIPLDEFYVSRSGANTWIIRREDTDAFWTSIESETQGEKTFSVLITADDGWGPVTISAENEEQAVQKALDTLVKEADSDLEKWAAMYTG